MSNTRIPGPVCSIPNEGSRLRSDSFHSPPGRASALPGPAGQQSLTPEQQELALDVAQVVLDIIGIFEPTPFADGSNALISLGRFDWLGAGLSALGIIPYLGDLAKAGKLPRYLQTLWKAVNLAKKDANFARYLRPALQPLKNLLDALPMDRLSTRLQEMVKSLQEPLVALLGRGVKHFDDLDSLTERLLHAKGFAKNISASVRANVRTTAKFLSEHGIDESYMIDVLNGIDLHSPVTVEIFKKGELVTQYVDEATGVGSWFARSGGGHGMADLGITEGNRVLRRFRMTSDTPVLKSRSAAVVDTWTQGRAANSWKPKSRIRIDDNGKIDFTPLTKKQIENLRLDRSPKGTYGTGVPGGGTQYYLPQMEHSQGQWLRNTNRWESVMEDYRSPLHK